MILNSLCSKGLRDVYMQPLSQMCFYIGMRECHFGFGGLASILSLFRNELNRFNNIGAQMLDYI